MTNASIKTVCTPETPTMLYKVNKLPTTRTQMDWLVRNLIGDDKFWVVGLWSKATNNYLYVCTAYCVEIFGDEKSTAMIERLCPNLSRKPFGKETIWKLNHDIDKEAVDSKLVPARNPAFVDPTAPAPEPTETTPQNPLPPSA